MKRMHFWRLPDSLIRLMNMTVSMHGKCGKYVFQNSHGGRQVKLYIPEIYKNEVNTPLRKRTREIMKLAMENPVPTLKEKMEELYRTYPYYLLKDRKENLRVTNFYFDRSISPGVLLRIYKMTSSEPDPENDELYQEFEYNDKQIIHLQFSGDDEERFYAHNVARNNFSNLIQVFWGEEREKI